MQHVKLNQSANKNPYVPTNETLCSILNERKEETVDFNETTTGCGSGELVQRTIARDIHIDYAHGILGKGRFGQVWLGKWHTDPVAVKVFFSMHETSWARETAIYQTCMLRHENILGYIASDIASSNGVINMLLITEYHANGSLYDYLRTNTIDKDLALQFAYSTINGLNHLHKEIFGTTYKPSIVHRDLKSKNVLIKDNMQCCIADFGLAARYDGQFNRMEFLPSNESIEGSVRYMAPEILEQTLNYEFIDDLKKADIYSYALLVWEILSMIKSNDELQVIGPHSPPFYEYVTGNPSIESMRDLVCTKSIRPKTRFDELEDTMLGQVDYYFKFFNFFKQSIKLIYLFYKLKGNLWYARNNEGVLEEKFRRSLDFSEYKEKAKAIV
jgi:serine/threonine protein kinase